ncbi:MAG TPA: O-antigen ligase family protein [Candidatus Bathyarchaeia archaeon]|nr:O-antigen ligase family protein [Candidatus Bathyarchaeia archaeon]
MKPAHEPERDRLLSVLVFLYVCSVLLFPEIPLLSRSSILLTGMIGFTLLLRYHQRETLLLSRWMMLPFLFIIYALASILWAADPGSALISMVSLLSGVAGAFAVWTALLAGASWQAVVRGCLWSGVIIILSTLPEMAEAKSNMRLAGILGNPNGMAIHLTTAAFLMMAADKGKVGYGLAATGFVLFATIFSGSIKMILFWAVFLFFAAVKLHVWSHASYLKKAAMMGIYLLLVAFPLFVGSYLYDHLEEMTVTQRFLDLLAGENTSSTTRLSMMEEALGLWVQHPLIGNGIDQFRVLGSYGTYSHNNYAEMLADFGLLGTTLFYVTDLVIVAFCLRGLFADSRNLLVLLITVISFLWDFGMVSYMEKSCWLLTAASFYLLYEAQGKQGWLSSRPVWGRIKAGGGIR